MTESGYKYVGFGVTVGIHAIVGVAIAFAAGTGDAKAEDFDPSKANVVEAQLAYRSKPAPKQPQKRMRKAPKVAKPSGVSRDADKKVDPKKPDDKKDDVPDWKKFKDKPTDDDQDTKVDEDLDVGKPPPEVGAFDGSKYGQIGIKESKGHPFLGRVAADMHKHASIPEFEKGNGAAVGCIRLDADGKIPETKLWKKSSNANINAAITQGLLKLQKERNKKPIAVPKELLQYTTFWTCFKLEQKTE